MSEKVPVMKALERDPDFASLVLLQVLTQHKDLFPKPHIQEGDTLEIEFKVGGKAYPFQAFMDRLQSHYNDRFEQAVFEKAREMVDERLRESLVELEDTANQARKLFYNRYPELKTDEEKERW